MTGQLPTTYIFYCPASVTYSHEVVCTLHDPTIDCGYYCSVNNFYLTMSFVDMTGAQLIDTASNAEKCNLLNQEWINGGTYVPGSCLAPYVHTPQEICYFNEISPNYTLQCGVMSIQCLQINSTLQLLPGYNLTDNNGNPYYVCTSSSHSYPSFDNYTLSYNNITHGCQNPPNYNYYGLYAAQVPLSYVTTDSALDLDTQCSQLRNYVQSQAILYNNNINNKYTYCCNSTTYSDPPGGTAGICHGIFNTNIYPLNYNFNCSSEVGALWSIECFYNGNTKEYTCINTPGSNIALSFKCSEVDSYALYGQFYQQISNFSSGNSMNPTALSAINHDQCMVIRRSCHTSFQSDNTDFFTCDPTSHLSNPNDNEFCLPSVGIVFTPPSSTLVTTIEDIPVFYCGTNPQYPMYCSNFNSGSYDWFRCSNDYTRIYSPQYLYNLTFFSNTTLYLQGPPSPYLLMDCLYNSNSFLSAQLSWATDYYNSLTLSQRIALANSTVALKSGFIPGVTPVNPTTLQLLFNQTKPEVCQTLAYQCSPFTCTNGKIIPTITGNTAASQSNLTFNTILNATAGCPNPVIL